MLNIETNETAEGYTICRPMGGLHAFTVSQFRQSLAELASKPRLVIDMSGVPFIDSAGLGALIGGIRRQLLQVGDQRAQCCARKGIGPGARQRCVARVAPVDYDGCRLAPDAAIWVTR